MVEVSLVGFRAREEEEWKRECKIVLAVRGDDMGEVVVGRVMW